MLGGFASFTNKERFTFLVKYVFMLGWGGRSGSRLAERIFPNHGNECYKKKRVKNSLSGKGKNMSRQRENHLELKLVCLP